MSEQHLSLYYCQILVGLQLVCHRKKIAWSRRPYYLKLDASPQASVSLNTPWKHQKNKCVKNLRHWLHGNEEGNWVKSRHISSCIAKTCFENNCQQMYTKIPRKAGKEFLFHKATTGYDLTGRDSWFTKTFWIFTIEFFIIMSLFTTR